MPRLDPQRLLRLPVSHRRRAYDTRETILYALAVGFGIAPEDLPFVYEPALLCVPTYPTSLVFDPTWPASAGVDLRMVVHGALDLRFHRKLAPAGEVEIAMRIAGLEDKGEGRAGIILEEYILSDAEGPACTVASQTFVRGAGGFGGSQGEALLRRVTPTNEPDDFCRVPTVPSQALLFRQLGDRNPLHVDPDVARRSGFDGPIVHGACTFGLAGQAVLRRFCGMRPGRLTRLAARFAGPFHPGETLALEFWNQDGGVAFRATAAERGSAVLEGGFAGLAP